MKEYDRTTRRWVSQEEIQRKLKKRDTCKGGREHNFVLCLPSYVRTQDSVLGLDVAERYYEIEQQREEKDAQLDDLLRDELKIVNRHGTLYRKFRRQSRYYICTVCQKHDWKNFEYHG